MERLQGLKPLESRVYKLREPAMTFLCPLCATERAFSTRPRLNRLHFLQITFLTAITTILFYSLTGIKILPVFFLYWTVFEIAIRIRFKSEIPCPHCGFDATWYKKDVRVARKKIKEFWDKKNQVPETEQVVEDEVEEENPV